MMLMFHLGTTISPVLDGGIRTNYKSFVKLLWITMHWLLPFVLLAASSNRNKKQQPRTSISVTTIIVQ